MMRPIRAVTDAAKRVLILATMLQMKRVVPIKASSALNTARYQYAIIDWSTKAPANASIANRQLSLVTILTLLCRPKNAESGLVLRAAASDSGASMAEDVSWTNPTRPRARQAYNQSTIR